jgi:transposase
LNINVQYRDERTDISGENALHIEQITKTGTQIDIYAHLRRTQDCCSNCQTVSSAAHGQYWRHLQGLPWLGLTVRLHLEVQRFACGNSGCPRIYCRDDRVITGPSQTHRPLKRATSCVHLSAGRRSRTAVFSDVEDAHQRRYVDSGYSPKRRNAGSHSASGVVDDWAFKEGQTFGTILVDLEKQQPIDLLDIRETAAVTAWFQAHPEIEIVSRDRGKEFIKAVTDGAP